MRGYQARTDRALPASCDNSVQISIHFRSIMCEDPTRQESRKRPRASALSDVCKFTDDTFSFRNAVVPKHFIDSESESEDDFAPSNDPWQRNEPIDVEDEDEEEEEEDGFNYDDSFEVQYNNKEDNSQGPEKGENSFHLRNSPSPPPELSTTTYLRMINQQNSKTRELDNVLSSLQEAACASSISPAFTRRQQGTINVDDLDSPTILPSGRIMTVKVRTRSGIKRLQMKAGEPFGVIIIQLAKQENVPEENIMLSLRDKNIMGHDTPLSVNLSVADIIECIIVESKPALTDKESDEDMITIKVQGGDNASKKTFRVSKFHKVEELMVEYCQFRNLSRNKLVFLFDGDVLAGKETPEELDMEDENVIDVRIKK